jgi:6-phosphogluconate dehydrogenase
MMMVKAGKAVDELMEQLAPLLDKGDILIDGGNSYFPDSIRRTKWATDKGLRFLGVGVSGGEEGALKGPSIMPGGDPSAWPELKPIFQAIAAKVGPKNDIPCCEWVGNDGAGHYVKMVHNGIEYGDMQLICEAYYMMKVLLKMSAPEIGEVFAEWYKGPLNSYLIEITRDILGKKDPETGKPIVDIILDKAGQKGTGKWTSQNALDLGIAIPTMMEAVVARCLSSLKDERVAASAKLPAPEYAFSLDKSKFITAIHDALYASKIMSYAQGYQLLRAAAAEYKWDLNYGEIAMLWRGGCIIRAQFLDEIKKAYDNEPKLANLILAPYFTEVIRKSQANWRLAVAEASKAGIAIPAFSSALAYYDQYRSASLPANLLQAQRDYFGAHTYERTDKPGVFHTEWLQA